MRKNPDSVAEAALLMFQYRKRYGLHAMRHGLSLLVTTLVSIPQAVWIACNLLRVRQKIKCSRVSIPQAVWIACNLHVYDEVIAQFEFQYRKRYGLHAILSPGSLGNSEPKNRVSDDDPLFAFFPKVRGTFLSRKVLRKGLEASHSKGTFVHERNLILMAFSLDFRASLEQSIS